MLLNCGVGRKDLRVPWTGRRSNQSILKEMSWIFIGRTAAEAEAPVLWPPDVKNWLISWCWERLKAGEGDDKGWDGWMASPTQWTWMNLSKLQELVMIREAWHAAVHLVAKCLTQLSWTEQEDSTCQGATKPRRCSYGACMPRAHPLQQEKPPQPE